MVLFHFSIFQRGQACVFVFRLVVRLSPSTFGVSRRGDRRELTPPPSNGPFHHPLTNNSYAFLTYCMPKSFMKTDFYGLSMHSSFIRVRVLSFNISIQNVISFVCWQRKLSSAKNRWFLCEQRFRKFRVLAGFFGRLPPFCALISFLFSRFPDSFCIENEHTFKADNTRLN